ncbi:DUF4062 domain-containing protein [Aliiroseovarius sp. S1123]|uniref:DUF4062 domain-containing protein n=1 Tax=unclassified Aliiroseovarius TaxID=2623558 RepID=UPI001FF6D3B8|nr:DUF4062 domain-containing protein [Aliiroseovarius sp. S1123]MCK0170722.1 DUF4062 domain-containing protein [Aliiroseovarius sp. S1123]
MSQKKRYQIFISSTYEDLKEERAAVERVILQGGDIPIGMELFPATDDEQFEYIKSVIDDSDYYVLIIAGRYGTVDPYGVSYTEKEYNYAVDQGLPVLVMVHSSPEELPAKKCEQDTVLREKLDAFRRKVSAKRVRKNWETTDGLKLVVFEALNHAKATKPREGWVRGGRIASAELLREMQELRKENSHLKKSLTFDTVELDLPNVPPLDSSVLIFLESRGGGYDSTAISVEATWREFLPLVFSGIEVRVSHDDDGDFRWFDRGDWSLSVGCAIKNRLSPTSKGSYKLSDESEKKALAYCRQIGILSDVPGEVFTERGRAYSDRFLLAEQKEVGMGFRVRAGDFEATSGSFSDEVPF